MPSLMNTKHVLTGALLLLLHGCTFGHAAKFSPTTPGTCTTRVLHLPPAPGQYEEIGFVYATGGALASVDAAREELVEQACKLGADAVYIAVPEYGMCTLELLGRHNLHGVALKSTGTTPPPPAAVPPPTP
jgi:hypothetical protein